MAVKTNMKDAAFLFGLSVRRRFTNEQKMTNAQTLLAEYVSTGSELAFRELVRRYIDLVYSTALRRVDGDFHLAEDVAQTVFVDLARKARGLSKEVMLGGWLHQRTCHVAATLIRTDRRRQVRERQAMELNALQEHNESDLARIAPLLDEAIGRLGSKDRPAIILRFFEQRDFRSVGEAMGTKEDAARMRVSRALEKLQALLARQGVSVSIAGLGVALATETVTAAPAGLAVSIAGSVLTGSVATNAFSTTLLKTMAITNLKSGVITALVIAGLATTLVLQQQASAKQRVFDESMREQSARLMQISAENERLASLAHESDNAAAEQAELVKLRTESAALRQQLGNVPQLRHENQRLLTPVSQSRTPLQATEQLMAKGSFAKNWVYAFTVFSMDHNGRFPTNFEEAASFLEPEAKSETNITTAQFELVYQGNREAIVDPDQTIVLRERQPWVGPGGTWVKEYGFANGVGQLHSEPDGNFEAYERQHTLPPPAHAR